MILNFVLIYVLKKNVFQARNISNDTFTSLCVKSRLGWQGFNAPNRGFLAIFVTPTLTDPITDLDKHNKN